MLGGCSGSGLRPDYVTLAAFHISQPGAGPGPWPIGDYDRTRETTLDGLELGAEWRAGPVFGTVAISQSVTHELEAGRSFCTVRVGYRLRVPQRARQERAL